MHFLPRHTGLAPVHLVALTNALLCHKGALGLHKRTFESLGSNVKPFLHEYLALNIIPFSRFHSTDPLPGLFNSMHGSEK